MGKYFVMSLKFNKSSASDFGFKPYGEKYAINPNDNSLWMKKKLYDLGWGSENGYYRLPLPDFNTLFSLVLSCDYNDDMFGSAAIILDFYGDQLLSLCENYAKDKNKKKQFKKMIEVFNLKQPINRCKITGKSYEEIQNDFLRWQKVSECALNIDKC